MEWLLVGAALVVGYLYYNSQGSSQIITGGTPTMFTTPGNSISPAPPPVIPVVGVSPVSQPPSFGGGPISRVSLPPIYSPVPSPVVGKALPVTYQPPARQMFGGGPTYGRAAILP